MLYLMIAICLLLIFFIGASVFSFLCLIAYRLPRKIDFVKGRSRCNECSHELSFMDTFPIFGYILLKGKCRYCGAKLSGNYIITEISGGILAIICLLYYYPDAFKSVIAFAFISVLTVIALVDKDTMEIPNGFIIALTVVGIVSIFAFKEITLLERLIGIFCVSVPLFLITLLVENAFGGGDIKLIAASGIMLGWKMNLVGFLFALLTGGIYAIYLLVTKKADKKAHFAFGPFLCFGLVVSMFCAEYLIPLYLNLF